MSFTRVNLLGWALYEELTSAQMNQLDIDHANAIDGQLGGEYNLGANVLELNGTVEVEDLWADCLSMAADALNWTVRLEKGPATVMSGTNSASAMTWCNQGKAFVCSSFESGTGSAVIMWSQNLDQWTHTGKSYGDITWSPFNARESIAFSGTNIVFIDGNRVLHGNTISGFTQLANLSFSVTGLVYAWGIGRFVAAGSSGAKYSTDDGATWNSHSSFTAPSGATLALATNGDRVIMPSAGGEVVYTDDGSTWSSPVTLPAVATGNPYCTWDDRTGKFLVAYKTGASQFKVFRSTNAQTGTWSSATVTTLSGESPDVKAMGVVSGVILINTEDAWWASLNGGLNFYRVAAGLSHWNTTPATYGTVLQGPYAPNMAIEWHDGNAGSVWGIQYTRRKGLGGQGL